GPLDGRLDGLHARRGADDERPRHLRLRRILSRPDLAPVHGSCSGRASRPRVPRARPAGGVPAVAPRAVVALLRPVLRASSEHADDHRGDDDARAVVGRCGHELRSGRRLRERRPSRRAVTSRAAPLAAGVATAALVGVASATACGDDSPLVPRNGGLAEQGTAWLFLVLLVAAFVAYLSGLVLLRRRSLALRAAILVAAAVQLVPLASPLLLSTDAWTYWGYGWIAAEGGGNPYVDPPSAFPESPAAAYLGADWRDTTTV